jgi:membrane-bound lytic murein transglycosylase MltF
MKAFEKHVNEAYVKKKHLKISVVFIPVSRDRLVPDLVEGLGDIAAAGLTVTARRKETVDFTAPLSTGVDEVVVAAPDAPKIRAVDDLSGKEVHVRKSSSYFESLQMLNRDLKRAGNAPVRIREASEYLEDEDILEMVAAGLMPFTVVDSHLAEFWSPIFPDLVVYPAVTVRTGGEIAWMIRKDSPQLKKAADAFIAGHKKGTLFGNIMIQRYYRDNQWVKNAYNEEDMARFRKAVDHFIRYGDRYSVDWLLLGALAYQESGIDQSKRSPAGAVGVMQILPSTAAAPPIEIPDIEDVENNIHAGTKYLRHLHDRYFNDPAIDPLNQYLFTFASYNAGPARIAGLRAEAEKMGLDPAIWFDNVEAVAAKRIGRETVQYVSNIYKYYIAYRLIVEKQQIRKDLKPAAGGEGSG